MKAFIIRFAKAAAIFFAVMLLLFVGINVFVRVYASRYIVAPEEAEKLDTDAVIVLGARVMPSGNPGYMLASRLDMGIKLYENGAAGKLIFSGDHGRLEYNEVGGMYLYAVNSGVEADDIFLDHAGFSTYETAVRAKKVFCADSAVMVTQKYHLYRAVYCARMSGVEAYGVASDDYKWGGVYMAYNYFRESLAIVKDFFGCLVGAQPTYLGEAIPVSGSGASTHDLENNRYMSE